MLRNNKVRRLQRREQKRRDQHRRVMRKKSLSCRGCTACCHVLEITEINKTVYSQCEHVCSRGCVIYEARPEECRGYSCLYLLDAMPPEFRPDRVGVILDIDTHGFLDGDACLTVREFIEGAVERDDVQQLINGLAEKQLVLVLTKDTRKLLGPAEITLPIVERIKKKLSEKEINEK